MTCKNIFNDNPETLSWESNDGEVTLFQEKVRICEKTNISIESIIAAELELSSVGTDAFGVYRLYIDDDLVCNSGYQADNTSDLSQFKPNLETSSLTWTGFKKECFVVRVTAQVVRFAGTPTSIARSNVDKNNSDFVEAKGAFLRINLLPFVSNVHFFKNQSASWQPNSEIVLIDEIVPLKSFYNQNRISIFGSIAAQIDGINVSYNKYRLLINDDEVCRAGYQSGLFPPALETSTLIWSGQKKNCSKIRVRLLAELVTQFPNITSNVNILSGDFRSAKGAFLSIFVTNDCNDSQQTFLEIPMGEKKSWTVLDGEFTLFDENINVKKNVMVNSSLAVETFSLDNSLYNVYRMYINGKQICQSGYDPVSNQSNDDDAPSLETSSLIGSKLVNYCDCCDRRIRVKITAQLVSNTLASNNEIMLSNSNVDNNIDPFSGAKGAFLSVFSYN